MEIRIRARDNWSEESVAKRLTEIVTGRRGLTTNDARDLLLVIGRPAEQVNLVEAVKNFTSNVPFEKESGYKWALDQGNDWWMSPTGIKVNELGNPDPKGRYNEYKVAYRYGNDEVMEGLRRFLNWTFN